MNSICAQAGPLLYAVSKCKQHIYGINNNNNNHNNFEANKLCAAV